MRSSRVQVWKERCHVLMTPQVLLQLLLSLHIQWRKRVFITRGAQNVQ
jgi:hypothetical protein